jgi:hypothetical protein
MLRIARRQLLLAREQAQTLALMMNTSWAIHFADSQSNLIPLEIRSFQRLRPFAALVLVMSVRHIRFYPPPSLRLVL